MILHSKSSLFRWIERDVIPSEVGTIFEGAVAANKYDAANYRFGVGLSTGASTDVISGIMMSPRKTFNTNIKVEKIVVASSSVAVVLSKLATSVAAFLVSTGAKVATTSSVPSSTNIQTGTDATTGNTTLLFDASMVGSTFFAVYSYAMTTADSAYAFGEQYGSMQPVDVTGKIGVIHSGIVYSNAIDPTAAWAGSAKVKFIAGGLITDGANAATGVVPTNVEIISAPTPDVPFVGIVIK